MKIKSSLMLVVLLGISGCFTEPSIPSIVNPIWITPQNSICKSNGGKTLNGECRASWTNAKSICQASGGRLATINELKQVITDCGGEIGSLASKRELYDRNQKNSSYQQCVKEKGFHSNSTNYWSISPAIFATHIIRTNSQYINFKSGYESGTAQKGTKLDVRCVRVRN